MEGTINVKHFEFNLFGGYSDKHSQRVSLERILELITTDATVRDLTQKHRYFRAQGNEAAARHAKHASPCFAPVVRFSPEGKRAEHILALLGIGQVDFDHIPPERMAAVHQVVVSDPHTWMMYRTISGEGFRILFRYEPLTGNLKTDKANYPEVFRQGCDYYARLTGLEADPKCKNLGRLSGLAHDPQAFYRAEAQPFQFDLPAAQAPAKPGRPRLAEPSAQGRQLPKAERTAPADTYHAELEDAVAVVADRLEREGVAYEPGNHNTYIMRFCYLLNELGVPQEQAEQWATGTFADYGEQQVTGIVRSCYTHTERHGTRQLSADASPEKGGAGRKSAANVKQMEEFIASQATVFFNKVSRRVDIKLLGDPDSEHTFRPMDARHTGTLWCRMNKAGIHARYHDLNTVLRSEFVQPYHPMEVYLSTLPPWDGTTDHIARLAATIHVKGDVAFWERNFKKWLVAWFAGILDEQVVNHVILVLISETQGTYKTTWFQRLLAPALRNYFQPRPFTGKFGKDDRLAMAEFFLICIDELDTMPPSALNQLKAMVTELTVVERAPYAEFKEVRPHIASFCGTGNHLQFLSDPTGNRRMFPVEVTDIDDPYTTVVDYAGVYAQAYALYKSGFVYWFTAEEVAALNAYNRDFEAPSEEEELIRVFFRNPKPGETGLLLSASEIAAKIGVYTKKQLSLRKIATVLKGQGYVQMRKDGSRVYRVEEKSVEEIAAYRRTAANSDATEAELPF